MNKPLGTRAVMHRLWGFCKCLLGRIDTMIVHGTPPEEMERGLELEFVAALREPGLVELGKAALADVHDSVGNYADFYRFCDEDGQPLSDLAGCNSLDEIDPDLRKFVKLALPYFLAYCPECEGAEILKGYGPLGGNAF